MTNSTLWVYPQNLGSLLFGDLIMTQCAPMNADQTIHFARYAATINKSTLVMENLLGKDIDGNYVSILKEFIRWNLVITERGSTTELVAASLAQKTKKVIDDTNAFVERYFTEDVRAARLTAVKMIPYLEKLRSKFSKTEVNTDLPIETRALLASIGEV